MQTENNNTQENNIKLYDLLRNVPQEARKPITDGRLKGKTDVNAMWRIKRMTEVFGPIGTGWKVEIVNKWMESADDDNTAAFVDINLFVKNPETGQWSDPIPGTGGNIFKRRENSGKIYMDDDCYKKALTDAVSIACKFLGLAADVWFEQDKSKYETDGRPSGKGSASKTTDKPELSPKSPFWDKSVTTAAGTTDTTENIYKRITKVYNITRDNFSRLMGDAGKPVDLATLNKLF